MYKRKHLKDRALNRMRKTGLLIMLQKHEKCPERGTEVRTLGDRKKTNPCLGLMKEQVLNWV